MTYPFRLYGRTIELYRFQVSYTEACEDTKGTLSEVERLEAYPSREEADAVAERRGGTVTAIDTAEHDWLDGLEMPDVPDTYGEAVKVFEMGQAAYAQKLLLEANAKREQLRADIDFISLMTGVSL